MKRFSLASLRVRLLLLVLLAIVPAFALILFTASVERRHAGAEIRDNELRIARLAASAQLRLIEGAHQLLVAVAQMPEVRRGDPAAGSAALATLQAQYRYYENLGVASPAGKIDCSAVPVGGEGTVADLAWFREAMRTADFAIGNYEAGRTKGQAVLTFGEPVRDNAGQIQAVVFASLKLVYVNQIAAEALLPEGAVLRVVDRQGLILAQFPIEPAAVGSKAPEEPLLKAGRGQRRQGEAELVGTDGVPRLYAYTPVSGKRGVADLYVSVSIPSAAVHAEGRTHLTRRLLGLALVTVLALVAAFLGGDVFVLNHVNALVDAAQRMKAGDLKARSGIEHGPGELSQLAHAFDEMAGAVERREVDLEQRVQERTAELTQETNLLHSLIDHLPDFIYIRDLDGRYVIDNAAHRVFLGAASLEQVVGQTLADFFPKDLATRHQAEDQQVIQTGQPLVNREEDVTDRAGRTKRMLITKVPFRDSQGKIIGTFGIAREIAGPK